MAGWNFPIARRLIAFGQMWARTWRERHMHPVNFALHLPGIPLMYLGILGMILAPFDWSGGVAWYWGLAGFIGGFVLQWVGHCVEGNDMGELIPFKRLLGLPVVAVVPRGTPKAT